MMSMHTISVIYDPTTRRISLTQDSDSYGGATTDVNSVEIRVSGIEPEGIDFRARADFNVPFLSADHTYVRPFVELMPEGNEWVGVIPVQILKATEQTRNKLPFQLVLRHGDVIINSRNTITLDINRAINAMETVIQDYVPYVMFRNDTWEWLPDFTYKKDVVVIYNGEIYISLRDGNLGNVPSEHPEDWSNAIGEDESKIRNVKLNEVYGRVYDNIAEFDLYDLHHAIGVTYVLTDSNSEIPSSKAVKDAIDYGGQGLEEEIRARREADTLLQQAIDTEIQDRIDAVDNLNDDLLNEIGRATQAESDLESALSDEVERATTAENTLRDDLTTETNNRQTADETLQEAIESEAETRGDEDEAIRVDLRNEASERTRVDAVLDGKIDGEITNRENAVQAEAEARAQADAGLQASITSEENARIEGDNTIRQTLETEIQRAEGAEAGLSASINSVQTSLGNHVDARNNPHNVTKDQIGLGLVENADMDDVPSSGSNNYVSSGGVYNAIELVQGYIESEARERTNEDSILTQAISDERSLRESKDTELEGDIEDEATARLNEDGRLYGLIEAESGRAQSAESSLSESLQGETDERAREISRVEGLITAETSGREQAISVVEGMINSETAARESAINDLQSDLSTETSERESEIDRVEGLIEDEYSRATAKESELETSISTEANERQNADDALQSNIDGKVDKTFCDTIFIDASFPSQNVTASGVSIEFIRKSTNTYTTSTFSLALPVATTESAGIATSSQIAQIAQNREDIELLLGKSTRYAIDVDLTGMTDAQIQTTLTSAWRTASGTQVGDPAQYTTLVNLWNNHEYTWLTVGSTTQWEDRGISTVSTATNSSLGVVMGTPDPGDDTSNGNIYVDENGRMQVLGWDDITTDIANAQSTIAGLQSNKADKTTTVTNVSYDSSTKKIQKTINGTTSNVVTLATVATSGSYNDLDDKPTIPTIPDISVATSGTGNALTGVSVDSSNKHKLNFTKATFLTAQDITGKMDADMSNIAVAGTKADGKTVVWDAANTRWMYGEAGKVDDVKVNGSSVVTNKVANISVPTTYAGSSSAGGPATTALACTGNAATATNVEWSGITNNPFTVEDVTNITESQ